MSSVCIYFPAHQLNYQVFCTHFKNQLMASRGDILINAPLEWEKRERERETSRLASQRKYSRKGRLFSTAQPLAHSRCSINRFWQSLWSCCLCGHGNGFLPGPCCAYVDPATRLCPFGLHRRSVQHQHSLKMCLRTCLSFYILLLCARPTSF